MAPLSISTRSSIFCFFHGIGVGLLVGDEARRALQQLGDDTQIVGLQRRAGFGDFDDGVGEAWRLDLGGAPAELDVGLDAVLGQPAARQVDDLRGDALAV